jgi:hypothetical protein
MNLLRNTQIPQFPKSSPTFSFHSCLETKEVGSTGLIWSRSAYILHWISFCADSRDESTVVLREMHQQSEESALPSGRSRRRGVRPNGAKGDNHWECEP